MLVEGRRDSTRRREGAKMVCQGSPPLPVAPSRDLTLMRPIPQIEGPLADGAVLQREAQTPIWGRAAPGRWVEVDFAGQTQRARAGDDGRWVVRLAPMPADERPRPLIVRSPEDGWERRFEELRVGEVWLAAGQSNMELPLRDSAEPEWRTDPLLRLCRLPVAAADAPARAVAADWACPPPDFSAVAYHMGAALREALRVPVGMICACLGSTGIASWLSPSEIAESPYRQALYDLHAQRVAYHRWAQEARRTAADPQSIWLGHDPRLLRPSGLFNGMIAPLQPWALRGIVWYQGEADTMAPERYEALFKRLIASWRRGWGQDDLPFLFVQLSAFDARPPAHRGDWPALRQAQARVADTVPRAAMVVSIDAGDKDDIHPRRKKCIGDRLALAALAVAYGQPVHWRGPRPLAARRRAAAIEIAFEDHGQGLTTRDGQPPRGFELVDGGQALPTPARLDGHAVQLPGGGTASAVRYAWSAWTDANLCDARGLPAAPFELPVLDATEET